MATKRYINESNPLLLASASPRRKAILDQIGIPFTNKGCNINESIAENTEINKVICNIAVCKAKLVSDRHENQWVLGADTIVELNNNVFGKPKDALDCYNMLAYLSGKSHRVVTGFCILNTAINILHVESVTTTVKIKKLSDREIKNYTETGEPFGKAGSYAIQGIGSFMVEYINGSYTNVVGLPVYEVVRALIKCGGLQCFPIV